MTHLVSFFRVSAARFWLPHVILTTARNSDERSSRYDRVHVGTSAGGYPDFINDAGNTYITVAQKQVPDNPSTAYVHQVEDEMLTHLFRQHLASGRPSSDRLVLNVTASDAGKTLPLWSSADNCGSHGGGGGATNGSWPALDEMCEQRQGFSALFKLRLTGGSGADDAEKQQQQQQTLFQSGNIRIGLSAGSGSGGGGLEVDMLADRSAAGL